MSTAVDGTHIPPYQELRALLDQKGIHTVAIIDDAFNKIPKFEHFSGTAREQLVSEIQAAPEIDTRLRKANLSINSIDDLEEPNWSQLWGLSETDSQLQTVLQQLNTAQNHALKTLEDFSAFLQTILMRTVEKRGTDADLGDTAAKLIFIDYYLDERGKQESLQIADEIGSKINQLYRPVVDKPLIVLMSSRSGISAADRNAFRENGRFVGGMFHFISKEEFLNQDSLAIWLTLITNTIDEGRIIQAFVDDLSTAADDALGKYKKKLRALSVDDFACIQRLTLEKEGQPLSDYVLHLLSAYFSQLLKPTISDDQAGLNDLVFEELAYTGEVPSSEFKDLFVRVVSEPASSLKRHPKATETDYPTDDEMPTTLHFGDLFVYGNLAYIVATAECDLISTPGKPQRKFDPQRQVLLIPGTLQPYSKPGRTDRSRTEFVEIDSQLYGIQWDLKKAKTELLGSIKKFFDASHYDRKRRINSEFALEVQRVYFAEAGRIGLPVAPPIANEIGVELYAEAEDGSYAVLLESATEYAVAFLAGNDHVVQLTGKFLLAFPGAIQKAIEILETRRLNASKKNKYDNRIGLLRQFKIDAQLIGSLRLPFKIPEKEQDFKPLPEIVKLISAHRRTGQYQSDRPLILNLVRLPEPKKNGSEPALSPPQEKQMTGADEIASDKLKNSESISEFPPGPKSQE